MPRKVLGRLLRNAGHTVTSVGDGDELLGIFSFSPSSLSQRLKPIDAAIGDASDVAARMLSRAESFDAILVDRYMPKLEGPKAIRCA